jgi:hypothetical protein
VLPLNGGLRSMDLERILTFAWLENQNWLDLFLDCEQRYLGHFSERRASASECEAV